MRFTTRGFFGLIGLLAALATIVAACGSTAATATPPPTTAGTTPPTSPGRPTVAPTATPRATSAPAPTATPAPVSSGEITVAMPGIAFNLNPATAGDPGVMDAIYTYLTGTKTDGTLEPESGFFTAWSMNADSSVYTFKVRDNLVFHNGDKATARDGAFSFTINNEKDAKYTQADTFNKTVAKVESPDSSTVQVTLKTPDIFWNVTYTGRNPPLSNNSPKLAMPERYMTSVGMAEANKNPVGSGPYKFKSMTVGDRVILEAVERHFYFGVPKAKTLIITAIPEEATRLALMTNKTIDVTPISLSNLGRAKQGGLNIVTRERGVTGAIWNSQYPDVISGAANPLANESVRKALFWYAIDRKAIVDSFLAGQGVTTMAYPVFSWDLGGFEPLPVPAFDPAKAKQMLTEAGYGNGFEIDFYAAQVTVPPGGEQIAEAVAVYWEKVGIKVKRIPFTGAVFNQALTAVYDKNGFSKPTVYGMQNIANRQLSGPIALLQHNPSAIFSVSRDKESLRLANEWLAAKSIAEYKAKGATYRKYVYDHMTTWIPMYEANELWIRSTKVSEKWQLGQDAPYYRVDYAGALR